MAEQEENPLTLLKTNEYESIDNGDASQQAEETNKLNPSEDKPLWRRPIAEREDVPVVFKRIWKVIHTYWRVFYGSAIFLIILTLIMLLLALVVSMFTKHSEGNSDPPEIEGPPSCKKELDTCYASSKSSSQNHMCMALFRECADNFENMITKSKALQLVSKVPEQNFPIRESETQCSQNFKSCLIEAAEAEKRIRKYYFEGCLDDLKTCLKRENLGGKVLTCLGITGVCIAGTFYIPPEAVFVCSGVAATCAGYTLWSSFF